MREISEDDVATFPFKMREFDEFGQEKLVRDDKLSTQLQSHSQCLNPVDTELVTTHTNATFVPRSLVRSCLRTLST